MAAVPGKERVFLWFQIRLGCVAVPQFGLQLGPFADVVLFVNGRQNLFDRNFRQIDLLGDFLIRPAGFDGSDDFFSPVA